MALTGSDLQTAGYLAIDYYLKNPPRDSINTKHPLLDFLRKKKKAFPGGKEYAICQVRMSDSSNYQNYSGDDQVTYNKKDTVRQASYPWYANHDGFGLSEDDLFANGITLVDDRGGKAGPRENAKSEIVQLTNIVTEHTETLRLGYINQWDTEFHLSGSQSAKAVPGLDFLVSTTPTTGVVGGLDRSVNSWWQNLATTGINTGTQGTLINDMEIMWRNLTRYGSHTPDFILAGDAFIDAMRADAKGDLTRYVSVDQKGGYNMDAGVTGLSFHGVPVVWDPMATALDSTYAPTIPWSKRCYMLNSDSFYHWVADGHDMTVRNPPRVYDRYVTYWGIESKYALGLSQSNCNGVLSIA